MSNQDVEWYKTWFNSPYYHILYQKRNFSEAEQLIANLLKYLNPKPDSNCLDLACGSGRHSIFLSKNGLKVTGLDLSPENIKSAKKFENENLNFFVHDMRKVFKENEFDLVFNLFTSFGYFDDFSDNQKVLTSVYKMLKDKGIFVIDFMNVKFILDNLVEAEQEITDGVCFNIQRKFDGKHIVKTIKFTDDKKEFHFEERVQSITKNNFEILMGSAGFEIIDYFGDYFLSPFNEEKSVRLIIIAKKK